MDEFTFDAKAMESMSSEAVLNQLTEAGGANPFMRSVMQDMLEKLSEARRQYFRKPVATMPIGASAEHSAELAKLHPELRELIFEVNEARADAVFQGCRHLAVRRCLLQLLNVDSDPVDNPYAYRLATAGINCAQHSFVWRTHVPLVDLDRQDLDVGSQLLAVVDLVSSTKSIDELLAVMSMTNMGEMLVVAPYDPRMWTQFGGQQSQGAYTFEWIKKGRSLMPDVTKPVALPSNFFKSSQWNDWRLYVQPFGSSDAVVLTRRQYMQLFGSLGGSYVFRETRVIRNGFAEVSFIQTDRRQQRFDVSRVVEQEVARLIPLGHVDVPRLSGGINENLTLPGREFDLASAEPVYVRSSYLQRALQHFFTVRSGREVIPSMMRSLHANSARMVFNGAIVTAELMVDVEAMATVLERVVQGNVEAKARLSALSEAARVPSSAKSTDFASAIVSWAAYKAVNTVDVAKAVRDVGSYLTTVAQGVVPTSRQVVATEDDDVLPIKYGPPDVELSEDKEDLTQVIRDYADDVFEPYDLPYTIERESVAVDKQDSFWLRMQLQKMVGARVGLEEVQKIYDDLFPGNSMTDPTMAQTQAEVGDVRFIVDVQYFRASIPCMFGPLEGYQCIPSRLRTSVGADLMGSFRSLMGSLMKRNFNRPRPEAPGDRARFVQQAVTNSIRLYGNKYSGTLLGYFAMNPITVSKELVNMWAEKHPVSDVLAAATLLEQQEVDQSGYRLMPKDVPKPVLSLAAQGAVSVGQTIVFHSKDVIALTMGLFSVLVSRLLTLFDTNIRFAFGADEHTSGEWADRYLDAGYYVTEIDVPKFDKTQDWACFELVLYVMELCGCDPDVIKFWRKASERATVFNAVFHLVFESMFGNRSGNSATLATNCIVLLFAFLSSFANLGIVALLLKGDDSVLITKRPITVAEEQYLYEHWGFTMKRMEKPGVTSFCSSFFVKDRNDKYRLVRDVVRVIEKFGRALPVNKPASYFLDYYVSVVDTAITYDDPVVVANLRTVTAKYYGKVVDVDTLTGYVRHLASSSKNFLGQLYGLSEEQIEGLQSVDDAVETMQRIRSTRFTKGKELVDQHHGLRMPLIDKVKISTDWIFTD